MERLVLIPPYDHARCLDVALASAAGQAYGRIEILGVDDGSQDDTAERARAFLHADAGRIERAEAGPQPDPRPSRRPAPAARA